LSRAVHGKYVHFNRNRQTVGQCDRKFKAEQKSFVEMDGNMKILLCTLVNDWYPCIQNEGKRKKLFEKSYIEGEGKPKAGREGGEVEHSCCFDRFCTKKSNRSGVIFNINPWKNLCNVIKSSKMIDWQTDNPCKIGTSYLYYQ
jgi:hypothetical protein